MFEDNCVVLMIILIVFVVFVVTLVLSWNPCPAKCEDQEPPPSACDILENRHPKRNSPSIFEANRDNSLSPNDVISAQSDAFDTISDMYKRGLITADDE